MPFTDSRVHGEKSCSTHSPWASLKVGHDDLSYICPTFVLGCPSAALPADPQNLLFPKSLLSWWAPPEWEHSKGEAAESLTAQRRSVTHPTMGVLLQTLIMTGISWHHYSLLLSVIFLQGKKFPVLCSKGSNLHVWSLSASTQVKRCVGFSRVQQGSVQHSKTPIFPSFLHWPISILSSGKRFHWNRGHCKTISFLHKIASGDTSHLSFQKRP